MSLKPVFRPDLYYEPSHSWLKVEGELVKVGVDDVLQRAAGRLIYVNPLRPGSLARRGSPLISLESSKWVGFVNSPVTGVVVEVNGEVLRRPNLINEDPYGEGWVLKVRPSSLEEDLKHLLSGDRAREWFEREAERLLRRLA